MEQKDEVGYTYAVGGYHIGGTGYATDGTLCGECYTDTCEGCKCAPTH